MVLVALQGQPGPTTLHSPQLYCTKLHLTYLHTEPTALHRGLFGQWGQADRLPHLVSYEQHPLPNTSSWESLLLEEWNRLVKQFMHLVRQGQGEAFSIV